MKLALLSLAALSLGAAADDPIAWTLDGKPPKAGATATLKLSAKVEPGWYLYGLSQPDDGPRPTRIWLPEGQPYTLSDAVRAPAAQRVFDRNFDLEVEKFKGSATFQIPVQSTGSGTLRVSVQYQTCSDTLCLPPKTVTLETTSSPK